MKIVRFEYKMNRYWGIADLNDIIYTNLNQTRGFTSFNDVILFFNPEAVLSALDVKLNIKEVKLLAPVLPTKNILCIGKNYYDHILEFDGTNDDIQRVKENPIFFTKSVSSINDPFAPILSHEHITGELDYEAELAVVIGKEGININESDAFSHIYGYTILNDVTARDLQRDHQQWFKGKSLDSFCPIGPWIVTKDEIDDPHNLIIKCTVNREIRQNANTGLMIHSIAAQIASLSKGMTLKPGDVIATGTPKGVGMGFNPKRLLKKGDKVEIFIENIGMLVNNVI